jgi:hypothetical protein
MEVSKKGGTPKSFSFRWIFPYKPSSYWVSPFMETTIYPTPGAKFCQQPMAWRTIETASCKELRFSRPSLQTVGSSSEDVNRITTSNNMLQ